MIDDTKSKIAQALRLLADALEHEAISSAVPSDDSPVTLAEIQKVYPTVTNGWLRGNVAPVGRGPRQRRMYRLSDVRAALESHPGKIRPKKCKPVDGGDELDALIASGQVER